MEIKVYKVNHDAKLPTVKYPRDAGMDFYALKSYIVLPNTYMIINTGVAVRIPRGYVGLLKPKGGSKWLVGSGVIDENYQGEILFKIFNVGRQEIQIKKGDAVGQMIILKNVSPEIEEVYKKEDFYSERTLRGASGGIVKEVNDEGFN